jgi:hypothetical protein
MITLRSRRVLCAAATTAFLAAAVIVVQTAAVAAAPPGSNLLANPGAEVGECSPDGLQGVTVPGWTVAAGMPNLVCYGTAGGYPTSSTPGSPNRGRAFFAGGGTGDSSLQQTVSLASAATAIDGGGVTYSLAGWLGGWSNQNDRVALTATFRNGAGATLASVQLGPVTATDRANTTKFLQKQGTGPVPAGTRSVVVALNSTWTAGSTTDGYADDLSFSLSTAVTAPALTVPVSAVPAFDHVFFVMMENENAAFQANEPNAGYIYGNSAAPYINNTLVPMGTKLTQMYAVTHPSDPNYLAVAGGSVSGVTTNPPVGSVNAANLADRAEQAGRTWKAYNQGANGNCDLATHGYTFPDDEPFTLYTDVANNAARCQAHIAPLTQMTADLASTATTPNFVWFAADDYNDMEQGGIAAGDTWLHNTLPTIFNSPAWTTQRSLLIVTWDEGYTKSFGPNYPNQIATVVIGSQGTVKAGVSSATRSSLYSLGRTVEAAAGLAPLTPNDTYAEPLNDVWTSGAAVSSLSTATPVVANGSTVTFNFATPAASNSPTNWVGIYRAGTTPGNGSSIDWHYTPGTSGTVNFTASYGAGSYQAYYLANDGYSVLAGPVALTLT